MLQTIKLEPHLEEIAEKNWTLIPLDQTESGKLAKLAKSRLGAELFRPAMISHSDRPVTQIRNDKILWLDTKLPSLDPVEENFLNQLEYLKSALKDFFRIHISEFECHYAVYDPGHFYQRHTDTTQVENKRIFSFVLYLNENWSEADAGQLVGYQGEGIIFKIKPQLASMIIFKSDLVHEVLPTNRQRLSITGWFRK